MGQDDESLDRLETALERIARKVEEPDPVAAEVAGRLDGVIARLRAGLMAPVAGPVTGGQGVGGQGMGGQGPGGHEED